MPTIASQMGLSNLQVSVLLGVRQGTFGAVNIGGGFFVDRLKNRWGLMLTCCMLWLAMAFALLGAAPNFAVLIIAVLCISIPGFLWHLPATAALSQRFPDRRGFAISTHTFGANIGNILGPLLAAGLLTMLVLWRHVLFLYIGPAVVTAIFVWWTLARLSSQDTRSPRGMAVQLKETWASVRKPAVLCLVVAAMLRGLGLDAIFHWTPFYLENDLQKGHFNAGFHYALVTGSGIISIPLSGILSDRFGRKTILVPGLIIAGTLSLLVVSVGNGIWLPVVLAGLGLFTFALHPIFQAAVLDQMGPGTEATGIGLVFGLNAILGIASPFFGFVIFEHFGSYGPVFYYSGILTLIPAVLILVVPFEKYGKTKASKSL